MRRHRKVKIVATLGPASNDYEMIRALFEAGADVFRLNMSHGDHSEIAARHAIIRKVEQDLGSPIAILADLQGPKLRLDTFKDGAEHLEKGAIFVLDSNTTPGDRTRVHLPHPEILASLQEGHVILIDDGKVKLRVTHATKTKATTIVEVPGKVSNRKGVSLPDTTIPVSAMTEKDRSDLEAALEAGIDWIALSFVQRPEDVAEVRKVARGRALIMSKIEKPQAIARLDEIMEISDALMVARGDLGVEIPAHEVPLIQKKLIHRAKTARIPVIVATQMMETMIESMTPTRAEVNDVANSVLDGADAVMLSGETSVGKFPVEVVQAMAKIIRNVEASRLLKVNENPPSRDSDRFLTDTVCYQASKMADAVNASAIVTMTYSGYTAERISAHRPASSIFVFTSNRQILNKLNLYWGVRCFYYDGMVSTDQTFTDVLHVLRDKDYVQRDETVITVASMPIAARGTTNMLKVSVVE